MNANTAAAIIVALGAIGAATIAAAAALISQWITGHFSLKAKGLELWLARKVDSYQKLVHSAAVFGLDPGPENYFPFLAAFEAARIVASPDVYKVMHRECNPVAQKLRSVKLLLIKHASLADGRTPSKDEPDDYQSRSNDDLEAELTKAQIDWPKIITRLAEEMQKDIASLAKVRQEGA
jgi:hypothetical protein